MSNQGSLILGNNQAHTFAMSSTLNKIKGIKNLTNKNYTLWAKQVLGELNVIYFDTYLLDIYNEDYSVESGVNVINWKCLLEFMFSCMDNNNAFRFQSALTEVESPLVQEMIQPTEEDIEANPEAHPRPGNLVPEMICGSGDLLKIMTEFHQADNKANLYLIQAKIKNFHQDFKTPISAHLNKFYKLKSLKTIKRQEH